MNSDFDQQSNTALIHRSLEEIRVLLSALETQVKSGMSHTQLEQDSAVRGIPEDQSPVVEDHSFLIDEL